MPEAGLRLRSLRLEVGGQVLVDGLDLDAPAGALTALVGPSGSGKSLTLRACLGRVRARPGVTAGRLEAGGGGVDLTDAAAARAHAGRAGLGWAPQGGGLDPTWRLGTQLRRAGGAVPVEAALAAVGLPAAALDRAPHALSGGQRQRAALALLLRHGAATLLLDEPTTGLDPLAASETLDLLRQQADAGRAVLLVTHDVALARDRADRVVRLPGGAP